MLIVHRLKLGRTQKPYATEACGLLVQFEPQRHEGEVAMVATVPDDHPKAVDLARKFGGMPDHDVVDAPAPPPPIDPTILARSLEVPPGELPPERLVSILAALIGPEVRAIVQSADVQSALRAASARILLGLRAASEAEQREIDARELADSDRLNPLRADGVLQPLQNPLIGATGIVLQMSDQAKRNGWSIEDLDGTGEGDQPGPEGGYSPRSGLCLVQLTLCTPPPGWDERAATHYPWEIEGWRAPAIDWTPPAVPAKRKPAPPPAPLAPSELEPEEKGHAPPSEGEDLDDDDEGRKESAYDRHVAAGVDTDTDTDTDTDPAIAAGYPADQVGPARRIAHELLAGIQAAGGTMLSASKFNWETRRLAKQEPPVTLHTTTEAQLAGLLARKPVAT